MSAARWRRAMNAPAGQGAWPRVRPAPVAGGPMPAQALAASDPYAGSDAPRWLKFLWRTLSARHVFTLLALLVFPFVATPFMTFQVAAQSLGALDPSWLALVQAHRTDALRAGLQQQMLARGLLATLQEVVAPLAAQVGEAWSRGELSVFQEHLFTDTVEASLREATAALAPGAAAPARPPRVLLTTLPGEQHTLGLLMAQAALALQRCETVMLGPDTPVAEIAEATRRLAVDVVALGTSRLAQPRALRSGLQSLRTALPPAVGLWVGGPVQALLGPRPPQGVQAVARLDELPALVEAWRAA